MRNSGTRESAAEILLHLDRSAGVPLRTQLEEGLRGLIRSGALDPGATLPSTRILAADLGVSRRMVVEAYQQLSAEGYLSTSERSATMVDTVSWTGGRNATEAPPMARYDLRPGVPALSEFPRSAWLKSMTTAIRSAPDAALGYPDPRGAVTLRTTISGYLRRVRGVTAEPDQVVICAGFTQALALLTQALRRPVIALENPGMVGRDTTIVSEGGRVISIPVDDLGLRADLLADTDAAAVVTTPTHQFPLGVTLNPARRAQLLDWAKDGRVVIEDDYDAEFRYGRSPMGAVQSLAPEHVVYVGTVSKTLAPALRIGWLVLPGELVDPVVEAKRDQDSGNPVLDQLALADLIDGGTYERHLRRVRRLYRERRDHLLAALHSYLPEAGISGIAAGLHLVVELPLADPGDVAGLVARARDHDLALTGLFRYVLDPVDSRGRIVVSYANITPHAIDEAVRRLADVLR